MKTICPEQHRLNSARSRARAKGIECTIGLLDCVAPDVCPVLGIPLVEGTGKGKRGGADNAPSLDRIDVMKGYTPDNVIIVSLRANKIKSNAVPEEIRKVADFYAKQTGQGQTYTLAPF